MPDAEARPGSACVACRRVDVRGEAVVDAEPLGQRCQEFVLLVGIDVNGEARRSVDLGRLLRRRAGIGQLIDGCGLGELTREEAAQLRLVAGAEVAQDLPLLSAPIDAPSAWLWRSWLRSSSVA
jgi:hypothetical protein